MAFNPEYFKSGPARRIHHAVDARQLKPPWSAAVSVTTITSPVDARPRRNDGRACVIVTGSSWSTRNYANAVLDSRAGTTAVVGLNGQGKTNPQRRWPPHPRQLVAAGGIDPGRCGQSLSCATVLHDDGREVSVEPS